MTRFKELEGLFVWIDGFNDHFKTRLLKEIEQ
jgi:hypothetical protein